jgi:hypothetical protein
MDGSTDISTFYREFTHALMEVLAENAVWNNIGSGMVIGGMAAAFFLDKPQGAWTKIGVAMAGLLLGWLCYSIASNILTYMHTAADERH